MAGDFESPLWQGVDGEIAVSVNRGEPRRTNLQMQRAVYAQAGAYLERWTDLQLDMLDLALAVQRISDDLLVDENVEQVEVTAAGLKRCYVAAMQDTEDLREVRRSLSLVEVSPDEVDARLLEQLAGVVSSEAPDVAQLGSIYLRENLRRAMSILTVLGFVVAKENGDAEA